MTSVGTGSGPRSQKFTDETGIATESLPVGIGRVVQCTRCDVRVEIGRPRAWRIDIALSLSHIPDVRAMTRARARVSEIVRGPA